MRRYLFCLLFFVVVPGMASAREVVGWVEKARIYPGGMEVKARVDTGAKTSSLGVDFVNYFKRGDEAWVRFSATSYEGKTIRLERKVQRTAKVKRDFGTLKERPVIMMGVCLSTIFHEVEVSLEDRSHMNYQMLIGRNFLDGHFLVDPGSVFINPPHCEKEISKESQE